MIYRLIKNLFQKKFSPNNIFEQRIFEYYLRYKLNKQAKEHSSLRRPYPNI